MAKSSGTEALCGRPGTRQLYKAADSNGLPAAARPEARLAPGLTRATQTPAPRASDPKGLVFQLIPSTPHPAAFAQCAPPQ
jgi:hypothetical protein